MFLYSILAAYGLKMPCCVRQNIIYNERGQIKTTHSSELSRSNKR